MCQSALFRFIYKNKIHGKSCDVDMKGISLFETIIVLVLIGILLGLFLPRMGGMSDEARTETARGDLYAIQKAIHAYYLNHNNVFPAGSDWQNNDLVNDNPRLLRQVLYDPFRPTKTEYSYYTSLNGKYYIVFSYGANQVAGITGINDSGLLTGSVDDDIYVTNGS